MSPVSFVLPMLMFVALMPISAGSSSFDTHINSRKGFVGSYHVTNSSVPGGTTKVNQVLNLGISAIENTASDGGWGLRDDLATQCTSAATGANMLWGMLLAQSEGGVLNNPNDTDLWQPLAPAREGEDPGPRGRPGLIQGAQRWSNLSKICPQIRGVIIDDFFYNYVFHFVPSNASTCVNCPKGRHQYGSYTAGVYCCPWPLDSTGHCSKPPSAPPTNATNCCLQPGSTSGCQDVDRCGTNPFNHSACNEYKNKLSLSDVQAIKGALVGKTVDPLTGTVDLSSAAQTPDLQLYIVWYNSQISSYEADGLIAADAVDGANVWIEGPQQNQLHGTYTEVIRDVRQAVQHPTFPVIGGAYISHSRTGYLPPAPFKDMLTQSIAMYDAGSLEGFFMFADDLIPGMNVSFWDTWALPEMLNELTQPWLGTGQVTVVDATGSPLANASVKVFYNSTTPVTSRTTPANGTIAFSGWCGKAKRVATAVRVSSAGYKSTIDHMQLSCNGTTVATTIHLQSIHSNV
eukprot:m.218609 g.218609  ORF g.218609 m.218609 type:complete len:516 (-) comp19157_c0_seq7:2606-4153(-)